MPLSDKLQIQFKNDFFWLLVAFCSLVFLPSFIPAGIGKTVVIYVTLVAAIVFSIISTAINKHLLYTSVTLAILVLITNLLPFSSEITWVFLSRMAGLIAFFSYTAIMVLYRIARAPKVSLNIIYGSIAGYLLMGILGGFWCRSIEFLYPGSYAMPDGWEAQLDTLTYFSFVTMSSLGYGDISPATAPGRSTAIFISVAGQMYLTINIALLVGSYTRSSKEST